jgi:hypothetical protein
MSTVCRRPAKVARNGWAGTVFGVYSAVFLCRLKCLKWQATLDSAGGDDRDNQSPQMAAGLVGARARSGPLRRSCAPACTGKESTGRSARHQGVDSEGHCDVASGAGPRPSPRPGHRDSTRTGFLLQDAGRRRGHRDFGGRHGVRDLRIPSRSHPFGRSPRTVGRQGDLA